MDVLCWLEMMYVPGAMYVLGPSVYIAWHTDSHINGVFEMHRTPPALVADGKSEISQLSCEISSKHAPFLPVPLVLLRVQRVQ